MVCHIPSLSPEINSICCLSRRILVRLSQLIRQTSGFNTLTYGNMISTIAGIEAKVFSSTRPLTRSGCCWARETETAPPRDLPKATMGLPCSLRVKEQLDNYIR